MTEIGYEPRFNQVERVLVNGELHQTNAYGPRGELDSATVASSVTRYGYDARGRVLTVRDGEGHQSTIEYETAGAQNTRAVYSAGSAGARTTTFAYDAHGRPRTVTNPRGDQVVTDYDAVNRVTAETGPGSTVVRYGYDDPARTYTLTDPKNQTYRTVENALGWVESQTDPRGGVERYAYDRNGNVTVYTNRRGQEVRFTYDTLDRVLTRTADGATTTFAYDADSRWAAASNGEGTDTLKTDASGRLVDAVTVRGGQRYVLSHEYQPDGQHGKVTAAGPWGAAIVQSQTYAGSGLLIGVRTGAGSTVLQYNRDLLVDSVRLATGPTVDADLGQRVAYTGAHQPWSLRFDVTAVDDALGRRYSYDVLERVETAMRGRMDGPRLDDYVARTHAFDALGRLTGYTDERRWEEQGELVCPDPMDLTTCTRPPVQRTAVVRQDAYGYDGAGNRTDRGGATEPGSNRLASFDGYAFEYDADGNTTRKHKPGVVDPILEWNALGQLVRVTTNGQATTFGYDGFGRRVRKSGPAGTARYLLDGDHVLLELDGGGTGVVREYGYYPGVDNPISVRVGGQWYYYATELPGHVTGLVDAGNQVVNRYEYGPFGEAQRAEEQVAQPLRFGARELDAETGLYYHRARYYDPQLGRFLSEAPLGLAGGLNPYAYAANDPVTFTDPYGLCPTGQELVLTVNLDGSWTAACVRNGGTAGGARLGTVTTTARPNDGREQGATANFGNPNARGGSGVLPLGSIPIGQSFTIPGGYEATVGRFGAQATLGSENGQPIVGVSGDIRVANVLGPLDYQVIAGTYNFGTGAFVVDGFLRTVLTPQVIVRGNAKLGSLRFDAVFGLISYQVAPTVPYSGACASFYACAKY